MPALACRLLDIGTEELLSGHPAAEPDLADSMVVTTGRHAYRDRDGIAIVPAALLGP